MQLNRQIKMLCLKTDLKSTEIARRLEKSPQAFGQKVKRGHLSLDELNDIAYVTGCRLECRFVFKDGSSINLIE